MEKYWAWEHGSGSAKRGVELVRADEAERAITSLQQQLAAANEKIKHLEKAGQQ